MESILKRVYLFILITLYVLQGLTLFMFVIAFLLWLFNIEDDYIGSYLRYMKLKIKQL